MPHLEILPRPALGEFARHELALLGAPCADLQALAAPMTAALTAAGYPVGYVDADHGAGGEPVPEAAARLTDKISFRRLDTPRALDRFSGPAWLGETDVALVNGNHFRARQQVVVVDPRKRLTHRLDQLTDVRALVLAPDATGVPDYLKAHLPGWAALPCFAGVEAAAGLAAWAVGWRTARAAPLRGLVLAGGHSTRMGQDKSRLRYGGPAAPEQRARAAGLLAAAGCQDVFISCRAEQAAEVAVAGLAPLPDTFLGLGPLGGILSAFQTDPNAAWLVLACDLPLLTAEVLAGLVAGRQPGRRATAFQSPRDEFPEPLCTIFEPRAYPELLRFLSLGYSCPRKMLINADVAILPTPPGDALRNVNTPEERRAVETGVG